MRRTILLLTGIALLGGCDGQPTSTTSATPSLQPRPTAARHSSTSGVNKDLAALRRATARFHRVQVAHDSGYTVPVALPGSNPPITCLTDPDSGGMGIHYLKPGLADGSVRVDQPEVVIYEPEKNGRQRLVAVEYLIPYALHSREADPPVLFGQQFKQNDVFGLWALHAWVWKHNPSGMFANWNPDVTCANADAVSIGAHH